MTGPKRERWTEAEVLALPAGEHDYFDRKSGMLLSKPDFRDALAKAICAFSNSGGGYLLLGVEDDGALSGVDVLRGRTSTREWLEQLIPTLLTFALQDFRVHEVEPSTTSAIAQEKVVIVVDVGDSALAPHQAEGTRLYYYRQGGHSVPAPHFYLEMLRNRLTRPLLSAEFTRMARSNAYLTRGGIFVETRLTFRVTNNGRLAAYKWALIVEGIEGAAEERVGNYEFAFDRFPGGPRPRTGKIRLDDTILPSLWRDEERDFGFFLKASPNDTDRLYDELAATIPADLVLRYRVVTETSQGETLRASFANAFSIDAFSETILPLSTSP